MRGVRGRERLTPTAGRLDRFRLSNHQRALFRTPWEIFDRDYRRRNCPVGRPKAKGRERNETEELDRIRLAAEYSAKRLATSFGPLIRWR